MTLEQVVRTIRNRIDQFGVAEPDIRKQADNQVQVQLPGLTDAERAIQIVEQTAHLEFHLVRDDVDPNGLMLPPGTGRFPYVEKSGSAAGGAGSLIFGQRSLDERRGHHQRQARFRPVRQGLRRAGVQFARGHHVRAHHRRQYQAPHGHCAGRKGVFRSGYSGSHRGRQGQHHRQFFHGRGPGPGHRAAGGVAARAGHRAGRTYRGAFFGAGIHQQRHSGRRGGRPGRYCDYAALLRSFRPYRRHYAGLYPYPAHGGHVGIRRDAHLAGHRGDCTDHRYGRGRQRAYLRAHPRGTEIGAAARPRRWTPGSAGPACPLPTPT